MISKEDATNIILNKFPEKEIRTFSEYSKLYVFEMVPKGESKSDKVFFDCTYSVNKNSGIIGVFKPSMLDESERPKTDFMAMLKKVINK